eukprot:gene13602-19475_t
MAKVPDGPCGGEGQRGANVDPRQCVQPGVQKCVKANAYGLSCQAVAEVRACASVDQSPRRAILLGGLTVFASGVMLQTPKPAAAGTSVGTVVQSPAPSASGVYTDPVDKFALSPPKGWLFGEGQIGGTSGGTRRTLAWFPEGANARDINITVTVTNVSVEFTGLGSFGNIDAFASNLINSLDRSYLLRTAKRDQAPEEPIQIAKLVDYKGTSDQYSVEYTVQQLPEAKKHLMSVVQLGTNGKYNRLYTATAQCREDDLQDYKPQLEAALKSFKANAIV